EPDLFLAYYNVLHDRPLRVGIFALRSGGAPTITKEGETKRLGSYRYVVAYLLICAYVNTPSARRAGARRAGRAPRSPSGHSRPPRPRRPAAGWLPAAPSPGRRASPPPPARRAAAARGRGAPRRA